MSEQSGAGPQQRSPRGRREHRREEILQALAAMLQRHPGSRITTAALAREVGVSEAALYRHFPSKARMFEGLIEFMEDATFSRVARILAEERDGAVRCQQILGLLLHFVERNPGFARLLTQDVLAGETDRLRARIRQFFDRLEVQLRQVLREAGARGETQADAEAAANLGLSVVEGHIMQFVRSDFTRRPTAAWPRQWGLLERALFGRREDQPDAAERS